MDDLITWLRAQLDEDERVALEAVGKGHPSWTIGQVDGNGVVPVLDDGDFPIIDRVDLADAEHVVRWDPARAQAEVAAKRRVIDVLRGFEPNDEWDTQPDMGQRANNAAGALRALAQPYAGRPGWREEWRT